MVYLVLLNKQGGFQKQIWGHGKRHSFQIIEINLGKF